MPGTLASSPRRPARPAIVNLPERQATAVYTERKTIEQLLGWAAAFPQYAEALIDCADEFSPYLTEELQGAIPPLRLKPGYKTASQMILTLVTHWLDIFPAEAPVFQGLIEEIREIDRPKLQTPLGKVHQALSLGHRTMPQILTFTKLYRKIVQGILDGMIEIGMVRKEEQAQLMDERAGGGSVADIYILIVDQVRY